MAGQLITKRAFSAALKQALADGVPLGKVTVTALARACGVNRQTFYYHFADVYDLVVWTYASEMDEALGSLRTYATWHEGLLAILGYLAENRAFVTSTTRAVEPVDLRRRLSEQTQELIAGVVAEQAAGTALLPADKAFIARFYAHGFVGLVLDWIDGGMRDDPRRLVERLGLVVRGDFDGAIGRMVDADRDPLASK